MWLSHIILCGVIMYDLKDIQDKQINNVNLTIQDLDDCIDYFEDKFTGSNHYFVGDGNYRNSQPIFGYGRS
jgi:hypothetical protein